MRKVLRRKLTARIVFIAGLFLMILGITFLLGSIEGTSRSSVFFAFLFVVLGAFCAVFAIRLNKQSYYLFFASLFMMAGIFLLLSALRIVPVPVSRAWPLLSVFSGLALLPVGWRRCGRFSTRYFVSACSFVALGCVLLVFSLRVVPFSFKQFIAAWWPLLFILGGITIVLISMVVRNNPDLIPRNISSEENSSEGKKSEAEKGFTGEKMD